MKTAIMCKCGNPVTMNEIIEVGRPEGPGDHTPVFIGYYCFTCKEVGEKLVARKQWNACFLAKRLEV